jgi:hypothetical protein
MKMKNSSDTIGNRTHDISACGAVPQPTAPTHLLIAYCNILKLDVTFVDNSLFCRRNAVAASVSKLSIQRWISSHKQELETLDTQAR